MAKSLKNFARIHQTLYGKTRQEKAYTHFHYHKLPYFIISREEVIESYEGYLQRKAEPNKHRTALYTCIRPLPTRKYFPFVSGEKPWKRDMCHIVVRTKFKHLTLQCGVKANTQDLKNL